MQSYYFTDCLGLINNQLKREGKTRGVIRNKYMSFAIVFIGVFIHVIS